MTRVSLWGHDLDLHFPEEEGSAELRSRAGEVLGPLFANRGWLIALAIGVGCDYQTAEDVVQDAYLHATEKFAQLRDERAAPGWIKQMVYRMAINRRKRERREVFLSELEGDNGPYDPGPENARIVSGDPVRDAIAAERAELLARALGRVDGLSAQVAADFYLQELTIKEISAMRSVPVGTGKRRLHTARERLGAVLADDPATAGMLN